MNKIWLILPLIFILQSLNAYELKTPWQPIDVHGFVSLGYLKSRHNNIYADTEQGTFQFNEAGLNFATEIMDYLQAGIQFHSRDLGNLGNNDVNIDWAFVDYRYQDWLGFRAGKVKLPLGFHNTIRDYDFLRTSIFLPNSIYNESLRDILSSSWGVNLYGFIPLQTLGNIDYQIIYGESDVSNDSATIYSLESKIRLGINHIEPVKLAIANIQWSPPIDGLRLGASAATINTVKADALFTGFGVNTPVQLEIDNFLRLVLSMSYTLDNWVLEAEFASTDKNTTIKGVLENVKNTELGYYIGTTYRFNDWFELGAYYDVFYEDKDDKDGAQLAERFGEPNYNAWRKDWVISARFDINESLNFKIEGHFLDGTAEIFDIYNPHGTERNSFLLAIKTTLNF